jgi:hypothetical protein
MSQVIQYPVVFFYKKIFGSIRYILFQGLPVATTYLLTNYAEQ